MSHHRLIRKGLKEWVVGSVQDWAAKLCGNELAADYPDYTDLQETDFCLVDLGFFSFRSAFIREIRG